LWKIAVLKNSKWKRRKVLWNSWVKFLHKPFKV
jgi:hypothetical protein